MVCLFESECAQPCIQRLHATGAFQPCTCSSETTLMAVLSQIFLCRRATRGPKKNVLKLRNSTPADDAERREADAAEERGRVHASDRAAEGAPARAAVDRWVLVVPAAAGCPRLALRAGQAGAGNPELHTRLPFRLRLGYLSFAQLTVANRTNAQCKPHTHVWSLLLLALAM